MKTWTYAEAREKLQDDLDLQEELFITPNELMGYFNDAIDEAETIVHNLYEDYFLTSDTVTVLNGVSRYPMPVDIFANKLRLVTLDDDCETEIKRAKLGAKSEYDLAYNIQHRNALEGITFNLLGTTTPGQVITRWYIRNANRVSEDSSLIDIPESMGFIFAYVKAMAMTKESHPMIQKAMADLDFQRQNLTVTLQSMVPDGDNYISPDLAFYMDHL